MQPAVGDLYGQVHPQGVLKATLGVRHCGLLCGELSFDGGKHAQTKVRTAVDVEDVQTGMGTAQILYIRE